MQTRDRSSISFCNHFTAQPLYSTQANSVWYRSGRQEITLSHSGSDLNEHGWYHGCPPCWAARGVAYSTDPAARNLLGLRWEEKRLETDLLLLCEDGSHGLDLSFVTHLFLVNAIRDPAKLRQVISRAHRMGATGPVLVQTLHMWND